MTSHDWNTQVYTRRYGGYGGAGSGSGLAGWVTVGLLRELSAVSIVSYTVAVQTRFQNPLVVWTGGTARADLVGFCGRRSPPVSYNP
jgi:hypothetical protein